MLFDLFDALIHKLLVLLGIIHENETTLNNSKINKLRDYLEKPFMTYTELTFYKKLTPLFLDYNVIPQVNLATIIKTNDNKRFQNELYRNIDFAIFSKDFSKVLLLIELNDRSHMEKRRKSRDIKVKTICSNANIPLITFYTDYPNLQDYVLNRINNELKKPLE
jgi:hypothetical protein